MDIFLEPDKKEWAGLCQRAVPDNSEVEARVRAILKRVKEGGDSALRQLSSEIDGVDREEFKVSDTEFEEAAARVSDEIKTAVETAWKNIYAFHKAQMPKRIEVETAPGVRCIQKPVPINSIGLYIPGGTAPLFSTVLMLAVPSMIAGCPVRIMCTPTGKDGKVSPEVLYTAARCGIRDIYKLGGAQAVAAMAYGTESISRVDKIFGPGNRYVTTAKQLVSSEGTAIDMPAGPSEVMVLADSTAVPRFVAADLLSQAEHGRDSQVILVCNSKEICDAVLREVELQAAVLPRGEMIKSSLANSRAIIFSDTDRMLEFADSYAPEHLIISMENADELAERVNCAGSIFIGNYSPESAGDYASGTNHTLPTSAWAHSFSGVNVDSFLRKTTLQKLTRKGLGGISECITALAGAEGLDAHANAVRVRMESPDSDEPCAFDPMDLVRANIRNLEPYSTARDEYQGNLGIFLDANESPYENGYNRYPDPRQRVLKKRISAIKGIPEGNIFLGNGSDEAIDLIYRVFCEPGRDNVVSICPSYGMYKVAAATNDVEFREVLLGEDFSLDTEALLDRCDALTKAIFICSPNNPSGNAFPLEDILSLAGRFRGLVVVDEAYSDFCSKGSAALKAGNVIVLQTMSKARGLAGLRIGLALADEKIINLMSMVKYPYNINQAAQEIALKALEKPIDDNVAEIVSERERLLKMLPSLEAVKKVWPSEANFLLVRFDDPDKVYELLIAAGIIVRNRSRVPLCKGCLRITVGTPEENERLVNTLKHI